MAYSLNDVVHMSGYSRRTLRRWVDTGEMPSPIEFHPGPNMAFDQDEIDEWLGTLHGGQQAETGGGMSDVR